MNDRLKSSLHWIRAPLGLIVVLVLWQLLTVSQDEVAVFPPPTEIVATMANNGPLFLNDVAQTLKEASIGFLMAVAFGLLLALSFLRFPAIEKALGNVAVTMYSIPFVAVVPILVIWFGNGDTPKIVCAFLSSFFPILVSTTRGVRDVRKETLELMQMLDASAWQMFVKVRLRTALPYMFAGFKVGFPAAVLGATVGEWINSESGLGYRILASMYNFQPAMLWATMVVSALLALVGYGVFAIAERLVGTGRAPMTRQAVGAR